MDEKNVDTINDVKVFDDDFMVRKKDQLKRELMNCNIELKSLKTKNVLIGVLGVGLIIVIYVIFGNMQIGSEYFDASFFAICSLYILTIIVFSISRYQLRKIRIKEIISQIELELQTEETLLSDGDDIYSQSIKMSYTYLNRYYAQTQEQASKGFFVTVLISVFGAIIIIVGIISMYFGMTNPAYITVATGALTEIISSIFFYLYNKTVSSMSKYHDKLVLSQNIAYALQITDSLSEEKKDDAKKQLMLELVKDINVYLHNNEAH